MVWLLLGGVWLAGMFIGIVSLQRKITPTISSETIMDLITLDKNDDDDEDEDDIEDAEFREIENDNIESLKETLLGFIHEEADCLLSSRIHECITQLDSTESLGENLDDLKKVSFNPAIFNSLEDSFIVMQQHVIQNVKDIITICIACRNDDSLDVDDSDLAEIDRELSDNERILEKFKKILKAGAKYAIQKDTKSVDYDLDSWETVLQQLNNTPPLI